MSTRKLARFGWAQDLSEAVVTLVNRLARRDDFPPRIMSTLSCLGKCEEKLFPTMDEI
jgi:hypothetical protein